MSATIRETDPSTVGVEKGEERESLFEDILHRGDRQDDLFKLVFIGGLSFLGVCLQPNVDPHTGFLLPISICALFFKLARHDLRVGQLGFYLRFVLKSCWEIVRRHIFDDKPLSSEEQSILTAQGIVITETMRAEAKQLRSVIHLDFWSNLTMLVAFSGTSLGVASIRTWPLLLHLNLLTLFLWILGYTTTVISVLLLLRKRVR